MKLVKKHEAVKTVALKRRFEVYPGQAWRARVRYQSDVKTGGLYMIFTSFGKDGTWLGHQGKVEEVYLRAYRTMAEDRLSLGPHFVFYNHYRLHQVLTYHAPG